jgi:hypothetical protein
MPILSGVISSAVGVPGAPTIGTATISGTTATVPYTAPTDNGGSTITSYTAVSSPGGITGTLSQAGSGSITVSGLTGGTSYTFTVYATNAFGNGPNSSASNSVTATVVGAAITNYKFYSVYNGGLRSANYVVEWSDDNSSWTQAWSGLASNFGNQCGLLTGSGGGGSYGTHRYWRMRDTGGVSGHFPRVARHVLTRSNGTDTNIRVYVGDNCSDGGDCCGGYVVGWDFLNNVQI